MKNSENNKKLDLKEKKKKDKKIRRGIPGVDYKVEEILYSGILNYEGLNDELRRLGFKTSSYNPR